MNPEPISNPIVISENAISTASERQSSSWDIRNAPRNYMSLVLFQAASAAFSFGAVWLITRHLGSEGYGGIVAVIAASQVAQVLVNWTSIAVVRFGVDEFIETEKIARTFWIRLIILLINFALVFSLSAFWFPPLAGWLKLPPETFWLVLLHFAATALWIHVQYSLQGAKKPRVLGFFVMLEKLFVLVGLGLLLAAGRFDGMTVIMCYIAAPASMILAGAVKLHRYVFTRFAIDRAFVKKILAYSVPLLPFSLVGYFSGSYVDAVFVSKFLSTHDLGIYSVATQISGITMQLPTLANTLLLPLFITLQKESQSDKTFNYFRNILPSVTLFWGLGCGVLSLIFYFAIPVIFDSEFSEAIRPLWILLTASVTAIPLVIGYSPLSNAASKTHVAMFGAIVSAVVNITGNAVLIPKYGLLGCAWSTLIAYFAGTVTYAMLLRRAGIITFSWTPLAVLPSLVGTIILTIFSNPWWAIVCCAMVSLIVGYWSRESINHLFPFLKSLRRAS